MSIKKLDPKVYFNDGWPFKICIECRKAIDSRMIVTPPKFYTMATPGPLNQIINAVWEVERRRLVEKHVNDKLKSLGTLNQQTAERVTNYATKEAWKRTTDAQYRRTIIGNTFRRFPKKISGHARRAFATCIMDGTVSNQQALWMAAQVGALEDRMRFAYVYGLVEDLFTRCDIAGKVPRCICDRSLDILDSIEYFGYGGVHPKRRNRETKYTRKLAVSVIKGLGLLRKRESVSGSGSTDAQARACWLTAHTMLNIFSGSHEYMVLNVCADYVECVCFGLDWSVEQCFSVMVGILKNVLCRAETGPEPVVTSEFQKHKEESLAELEVDVVADVDREAAAADAVVVIDLYPSTSVIGKKFWQSNDYSLPPDRFLMQDGEQDDGLVLRVIHNPSNQQEVGKTYTVAEEALNDYSDDYTEIAWQTIMEVKEPVQSAE